MPSSYEDEDVFFDSVDHLSSSEAVMDCFGYDIWLGEPRSTSERRRNFLVEMGFLELDLERLVESNHMVSSSLDSDESVSLVSDSPRESESSANCAIEEDLDEEVGKNAIKLGRVESDSRSNRWWRKVVDCEDSVRKASSAAAEEKRSVKVKVKVNKKKMKELSAVFVGQEIAAHEGLIWAMKFRPDGKYLATGGRDSIVRIWRTKLAPASVPNASFPQNRKISVVMPDETLLIDEIPLHEFNGHSGDILDLAWSQSNFLLSSSDDKTVRLWEVGCDQCKGVFRHNNYVTCVQFNPLDENYFISGSIDGKVRIWGVSERQVVDWVDARDVVTAVCYQPDGKGFVVGSITGTCRFYGASDYPDSGLHLNAQVRFGSRKRSSSNKITGIKFIDDSSCMMVTSEDCKVRILNGTQIIHKYKGLVKSRSQMSASFTSDGKHVISVGEDSSVYLWNHENGDLPVPASAKKPSSVRSCEHFSFEGVSVALPWSKPVQKPNYCLKARDDRSSSWRRDSGRFSLGKCFSMDGSATWPEEELLATHGNILCRDQDPGVWGLVIVTAGWDGMIRTFHNYGLPTSRV